MSVKYPTALAWSPTQGVWFPALEFSDRECERQVLGIHHLRAGFVLGGGGVTCKCEGRGWLSESISIEEEPWPLPDRPSLHLHSLACMLSPAQNQRNGQTRARWGILETTNVVGPGLVQGLAWEPSFSPREPSLLRCSESCKTLKK